MRIYGFRGDKMAFEAKVVADSISDKGIRLTTLQLKYPRIIHSEFMTHRQFSRNASSSRAIPVKKILSRIREEPAMPAKWGKNQRGMQAGEFFTSEDITDLEHDWLMLRDMVANYVENVFVNKWGLHKQLSNRPLEPWSHIYVVVTATEWDNFINLRCHADAQPEINAIAIEMRRVMEESTPVLLNDGEWHLPYVQRADRAYLKGNVEKLIKISVARCARVSYKTHDGSRPRFEEDLKLHDQLLSMVHFSPLEHAAQAVKTCDFIGNFRGWLQYRKTIPGEAVFQHREE